MVKFRTNDQNQTSNSVSNTKKYQPNLLYLYYLYTMSNTQTPSNTILIFS